LLLALCLRGLIGTRKDGRLKVAEERRRFRLRPGWTAAPETEKDQVTGMFLNYLAGGNIDLTTPRPSIIERRAGLPDW
jgi:hypothetical protein